MTRYLTANVPTEKIIADIEMQCTTLCNMFTVLKKSGFEVAPLPEQELQEHCARAIRVMVNEIHEQSHVDTESRTLYFLHPCYDDPVVAETVRRCAESVSRRVWSARLGPAYDRETQELEVLDRHFAYKLLSEIAERELNKCHSDKKSKIQILNACHFVTKFILEFSEKLITHATPVWRAQSSKIFK